MSKHSENIAWLDFETNTLPSKPGVVPLELAVVITDADLNEIDSIGPVVFAATEDDLAVMNDYVLDMHTGTGLLDRVRQSVTTPADFDGQLARFLDGYFPEKGSPTGTVSLNEPAGKYRGAVLAGNSVKFDLEMLERFFPKVSAMTDYHVIDVSSVVELARRWNRRAWESMPPKASDHTAMTDIRASIDELRYYRGNGFGG